MSNGFEDVFSKMADRAAGKKPRPTPTLSARQRRILEMIEDGPKTYVQIARACQYRGIGGAWSAVQRLCKLGYCRVRVMHRARGRERGTTHWHLVEKIPS